MVFRKLRNLVARQAQAAASKETANTQQSSDDEQPEPFLARSPRSSLTPTEVPVTVVSNKGHKRKRQVSESEGDEVPVSTSTDKSCKRSKQNSENQDNTDPFELMMNYFDKRFEGIEKKLQQPNKKAKMEDTFKFKSVLGWDTVAEYEADPIASDSGRWKEDQTSREQGTYQKRKSIKSNKLNLRVPRQKPLGQQFRIDGEHSGFTPASQQNFNLRFPSNNFTQDGYFRRAQWPSSSNVRSGYTCFSCGDRGHWRKYYPNSRHRN